MQLNREQIVRALEICTNAEKDCNCPIDCPIGDIGRCEQMLMYHALALIKELAEENERLIEALDESVNFYCSFTKSKIQNCPINDEVAKAKADTVRKMQERFKKEIAEFGDVITVWDAQYRIDQTAKEILQDASNTNYNKGVDNEKQ